ncbi:DUF7782 domain-containing protein [Rhodococcus triatomae]
MNRDLLSLCGPLREALHRTDYTADTVLAALGDDVHAALGRGEPVPVRRATRDAGELGLLVRLFLLCDDCAATDVAAALAPVDLDHAVAAGLLERDGDVVRAALDLRPMGLGHGNVWVVSDLDGSMRPRVTAPDHVLGVGHASLSLLRGTPTTPTGTVLDVGTGCGIQALHAATGYAESVTATDVNLRALDLSAATFALNDVRADLLAGSWFEPVAGRTFDRVVANPPFVVGRARVEHTYRDSGLDLDGASELMISRAADHLNPGGTASMLASWVHVAGDDWRARVASWLPSHGVDAWVVQRDVADPALYVGTWMRDAGLDPRDPATAAQADAWLAHFAANEVEGIGFGFVYLRRTDEPSDVLAEDLRHAYSDPLGDEALGYLDRAAWLRDRDVLESRFALAPSTALERVSLPGDEGWRQVVARVHRGDGPAWQHEIDDLAAALLGGMRADGLALGELVELLAAAHGEDAGTLADAAVPLVHGLVRHGLLLPASL